MTKTNREISMISQQAQRGSTLLFAMIFVLVLTVLAVSTMSTSFLDEKMAANSQFKNQAFQAGQSEGQAQFDSYINDHTFLERALLESQKPPADQTIIEPPEQIDHDKIEKDIELIFNRTAQPPTGFSFDIFTGLLYDQNTNASFANTSARSDQTQGINYAAPKDTARL